jgi:C_GCAxxG_C_C family probable redox protein
MWEAYGMKNEDLLWASTALWGGIAGHQTATCGAISSAAVCLGLRHRLSSADKEEVVKERQAVYKEVGELVGDFIEKYGAVACMELVGVDFSDEAARKQAFESGILERKCHQFIQFIIEKLYELEEKRGSPAAN